MFDWEGLECEGICVGTPRGEMSPWGLGGLREGEARLPALKEAFLNNSYSMYSIRARLFIWNFRWWRKKETHKNIVMEMATLTAGHHGCRRP